MPGNLRKCLGPGAWITVFTLILVAKAPELNTGHYQGVGWTMLVYRYMSEIQ